MTQARTRGLTGRDLTRAAALAVAMAMALSAGPAAAQDDKGVDAGTKRLMAANGLLGRGFTKLAAEEYETFLKKYPGHEQTVMARYGLAICRYRTGEIDAAVKLLEQVIADKDFKQPDEALALLGHCHMAGGDHAKALAAFDRLLGKHADSKHAEVVLLNKAQVLHMTGRHKEAVEGCKAFLKKYPKSARKRSAQYSLALAQVALGEHEEAAKVLREVVADQNAPVALDSALLLGQCHEAVGRLDQAVKQYERAVEIAPADRRAEGLYSLGVALYKAGDYGGATKTLATVLAKHKDNPYAAPATFQLGLAQLAEGKVDPARKTLQAVASSDPQRKLKALYWLAQCDMAENKHDAARAALDRLAKGKPKPDNLPDVLYDRALCTMALGRHEEAAKEFEAFAAKYPDSPRRVDAVYRRAFCLHKLDKHEESLALCKQVIEAGDDPVAPAAEELAAENLFLLGRYDEAAKAFEKLAKAAKPDGRKLTFALRRTQCAYYRDDYDKAIALARPLAENKAVWKDPKLRQAVFLLGDAQLQTGKFPDAARTLARYVPMAGDDKAEVQFKLGLAQLRAGNDDAAEKAFRSVLGGDSSWARRAMFEYAQLSYRRKQPDRARPVLEKLLKSDPPAELRAPATYLRGCVAFDAAKHADAAKLFGEVVERFPEHDLAGEARFQLGVCLVEQDKHEPALAAFRAYVKDKPEGKHVRQARHHIGRCLAAMKKHDEAAKILAELAADKDAADEDLLYELAWARRESDPNAAAKTYRRLLAEHPAGRLAPAARAELAELLYAGEDYAEAAKLLEKVVSAKSADAKTLATARYRLGWCYDKLGEKAKAAKAFSAFAEGDAKSEFAPSARYQAGVAYAALGKLPEARKHFEALIATFPEHDLAPVAMLKLGEALSQGQDYDRSRQVYERFLKQHAKSKFAFLAEFGIGWALENQRKYPQARQWYERVIESHNGPTAARAQFQIGESHFAEKRYERAVAELLKVELVYAYPDWSSRALFEAGRVCEAWGKPDQARSQYAACVAKYKDTPSAKQAAKRLEEMGKGT